MDFKTVGIILERYAHLSLIADMEGKILWKSASMEGLFSHGLKNVTEILGVHEDELRKISDKDELYILIDKKDYLAQLFTIDSMYILELQELGDYKDPRVRAESLLQVIENLYDGVLLSDNNGRVMVYNKAMEELEKRKNGRK